MEESIDHNGTNKSKARYKDIVIKGTENVAELVVSHSTAVNSAVQVDNFGTTISSFKYFDFCKIYSLVDCLLIIPKFPEVFYITLHCLDLTLASRAAASSNACCCLLN